MVVAPPPPHLRLATGGRRNRVPVGVELCELSGTAARTPMPSMPPIGQLAQLSAVLDKKVHSSRSTPTNWSTLQSRMGVKNFPC